jgi:Kef-type K+ transport system membrane component KefB/Trk K+ transport system NAD-binding subunit
MALMTLPSAFVEIAVILAMAAVLGALGQKLRQPLIIMFLAAGILAGPAGLGIIASHGSIELLAQIGIALLLFIVGLSLDVHLVRSIGPVALATGLGQIVFTSAFGLLIALAMRMSLLGAVYVAVALTFSSTIIVVKLLSDKNEIDSLHGQIAIGFLIVQDIAAIVALVILTTLGARTPASASTFVSILIVLAKFLGFLGLVVLLTWKVIPRLAKALARSQEMLSLFAVAWAVILGAAGESLGFSKEVGAFLAGVSLASTEYRDALGARLAGLRDFLLLFFFIDLGARLDWSMVGSQVGPAALFSVFVLIGNPLIVMIIMGVMGYRSRTGFLAGLTVAQISEFSLIVAAMGLSLGHISPEIMGLITLVGVATIFGSTYLILYSGPLYRRLARLLRLLERRIPHRETADDAPGQAGSIDVILVGLGNYGSGIAGYLQQRGRSLLGIDFDPEALRRGRDRGVPVLFGDVMDPDFGVQLPLSRARWVVGTARIRELNLALLHQMKKLGFEGRVALTAASQEEADAFEKAGADIVFRPYIDAAEQAVDDLTDTMDMLPENVHWPVAFREIRLPAGAAAAGRTVRDILPPASAGATILAVSRAGRVHYDPGADFQVFPGDRLVMVGSLEQLRNAEDHLRIPVESGELSGGERFVIAELDVLPGERVAGRSLADLDMRRLYSVSVIGIRRGEERLMTPGPEEILRAGDRLVAIGSAAAVREMCRSAVSEELVPHGAACPI